MASDINQVMQQSKKKQQVASADPVSIVSLAKQGLYSPEDLTPNSPTFWALEEIVARFEQGSRAHLGTGTFTQQKS